MDNSKFILFFFVIILIALFTFVFKQTSFLQIEKIESDQKALESAKLIKEKTDKLQEENKNKMEEIYKQIE
jgi:predicted Holliday junction resolvase-like endonuclease